MSTGSSSAGSRVVAVVPHTHWDREWYRPYQAFRLELVHLLDDFLPLLESDPSYARFLLDGQVAVVDDYLEVRPEAEATLRRLASAGRLAVGPWYILMDEFLVSGETIVRDLQLGLERAAAYGGAMPVGYLPDMFGHIAQMPQLLRQAGFEHAVVWRGVPAAIERNAFWWSAPDGSTVRAEYLWVGYGNGAATPDDAKALLGRIGAHESELGEALLPGAPLLWMNGTDHQTPQPWLGRVVAEANDLQDEYQLRVTSLPEYLTIAPTNGIPSWSGELRSGARSNLLMGVASNRVDVKQAAARAERALERRAEPWSALLVPADRWPARLVDLAWREMIRNAAHDSVCACSVDEVVNAVLHRYAEARAIADGLGDRALRHLAAAIALPADEARGAPAPVAVNPSARPRRGLVELVLPGEGPVEGTQVLVAHTESVHELTVTGRELSMIVTQLRSQKLGQGTDFTDVEVSEDQDGLHVVLHSGRGQSQVPGVAARINELYARAGARRDDPVTVRLVRAAFRRVLARVEDVPGFGWSAWSPGPLRVPPVATGPASLDNGLVRVEVDPETGTFSIDGLEGFDRLVDDGDAGDTYNWSGPEHDSVVDRPVSVDVAVAEHGPLRGRLLVTRTYRWPERVEGDRRVGERVVVVSTTLELHAGEHLVRVTTTFDNACRDHRLRSWFPLPQPAARSHAECAYAVVERGLDAEGGPQERALPTYPSRRFVSAGGLTVFHEGLLEYELVDIRGGHAHALALTLLRCTGLISGTNLIWRPLPAGPPTPADGAQLPGRRTLQYVVTTAAGNPYALADDALLPLEVVYSPGGGTWPATGTRLSVDGAEVSAVRRVGTTGPVAASPALEVRVFNPTPDETTVTFEDRTGWLVDLRGQVVAPFSGSFPLRPWGIATVHLSEP